MRRFIMSILLGLSVITLSACGGDSEATYNFEERKDSTLFYNGVMIDYKTDTEGKMIELNIDRLLTIEEMIWLNPAIDYDYELEGFDGNIFMQPRDTCTNNNELWIPINIEIGSTRYRFDNIDCKYETVDTSNQFKPGYAEEYYLNSVIEEDKNTSISIVVYNPNELVRFIEIYDLPHTQKLLGVYGTIHLRDLGGTEYIDHIYYNDMSIYEQLYLQHQKNSTTINEITGITTDINIMDLQNLTEVIPLIDDFETLYAIEIAAMNELQQDIGVNFAENDTEEEPDATE